MKYLLDNHSLSTEILNHAKTRNNLYVIRDVIDDEVQSETERRKIRSSGVNILDLNRKHLERLTPLLKECGGNFDLIRLYLGEGTADVIMLDYILAEREEQLDQLFPEEWTIVTEDKELTKVATSYKIPSLTRKGLLDNLSGDT